MHTTYTATLGDRGRLVVPSELRTRQHWDQGTPLLLIEAEHGVILTTREQAKNLIRHQLNGGSLVDDLLKERRTAARAEDSQ